jgi:isopentenyl-diphosphate delta-isomerase
MQQEYLDIVNDLDEVTGNAPREQIYEKLHKHRIVHVLIFNTKGEMALQMRSATKSYCPSHWSTAVGGHVQAGEEYEAAARREMLEEAGLQDLDLSLAFKDIYTDPVRPDFKKFLATFTVTTDQQFVITEDEVESIKFFPMSEIKEMRVKGERFHPELAFILDRYY